MEANAGGSVAPAVGVYQIKPRDKVNDAEAHSQDLKDQDQPFKYNFFRTFRQGCYSFFIGGQLQHLQYAHILPLVAVGNSFKDTVKKVVVTQTVFSTFGTALFYFTLALTEGRSLQQAVDESRAKTLPTLLVGWRVWPFISFFSFMFVPPKLQVAFVNFIAIFWSAYMSYMKNQKHDQG